MYACHMFDNIPQSLITASVIILIVHCAINVGFTKNWRC